MRIAKNTILKRAIEGDSKWEVVGDSLEQSNMWFFVGSDMKVRACAVIGIALPPCLWGWMEGRVCVDGSESPNPSIDHGREPNLSSPSSP